jgi:hypothetical protein
VHNFLTHFRISQGGDGTSAPTLLSGVRLVVSAMGQYCNLTFADWASTNLISGAFTYTYAHDPATAASVHTIDCPDCAFHTVSKLDLYFDASCQSLQLTAYGVNAAGAVTAVSMSTAAGPCDAGGWHCTQLQVKYELSVP